MNISLSDLANIAQIASIPLTFLSWLVSRERFSQFWKRWFAWIFTFVLIIGFIGLWNLGWLNWLWQKHVILPLWSIPLGLLGLCAFILIIMRSSRHADDHHSKMEESSFIQIGRLKWNATFSRDNRLVGLEQIPYCVQHEMKLVEQFPLYFCPLYGECNSNISRKDLPVAYQQAKSIIEAQLRKALK